MICGDGDLDGGRQPRGRVARRPPAASAGSSYVYDDNHITIDGDTELAYSDDAAERFEAYGWHVERPRRGRQRPRRPRGRAAPGHGRSRTGPSLLVLRSHIGYPSPEVHRHPEAHGNPLGDDEIRATKEILGLPPDETFWVPDDVLELYRDGRRAGAATTREAWEKRLAGVRRRPRGAARPAIGRPRPRPAGQDALPDVVRPARRSPPARRQRRLPPGRCSTSCPASSAAAPTSPATPAPQLKDHGVHVGRRARRPPDLLRRPRARHGRRDERHGAARRRAARRRHVLRVQRLHAARRAPGRACPRPRSIYSLHPRLGRPRRGRPDPPADRAPGVAAGHPQPPADPPGRRQRDRRRRGASPSTATGPTALVLTRQDVPGARRHRRHDGVARGAYVLRRRRRRRPTSCSSAPAARWPCASRPPSCSPADGIARPGRVDAVAGTCSSCSGRRRTRTTVLPPDVPTLAVEAGAAVRLGPLRRRQRRHRPLRRLGARATSRWRSSGTPPPTSPSAPASCVDDLEEDDAMTQAARPLRRAGPEPLARQPAAGLDHQRRARSGWVERGVRGITSNPTIFQKAIAGSRRLRRAVRRRSSRGGTSVDDAYWDDGDRRHRGRPRASCGRSTTRATASTATCRSRWRPPSPATPTAPSPSARELHEPHRRAQPAT